MPVTYKYPRPALAVDCVVFGLDGSALKVALIQRKIDPFKNRWAFPGGFVRMTESLYDAALRELREETAIQELFLEQLYTFGEPKRDPRDRVVSVAYYALVNLGEHPVKADTDAINAKWFRFDEMPSLAFDHQKIFETALTRLRGKLHYEPVGFELLPRKFTLSQLQQLYEAIWERTLDKRNFRKKILALDVLVECGEKQSGVAHRAASLYRFDPKKYHNRRKDGIFFEI
jgi:8-oxo-dGTP diphosphatase